MVYVQDINGKALMPTQRHWKVRRFLRDGLAVVIMREPFTIRLTYESTTFTQDVSAGQRRAAAAGRRTGRLREKSRTRQIERVYK